MKIDRLRIFTTERSLPLDTLDAGTQYTVQIVVRAEEYRSNRNEVVFTTQGSRLPTPQFNVLEASATSLVFSWAEIADAIGYEVSLYRGALSEGREPERSNVEVEIEDGVVLARNENLMLATSYTLEVTALVAEG